MTGPVQSDRAFGLTFAVFFAFLFVILWLVFDATATWTLWVAGIFLALALLWPAVLLPLNRLWAAFARRLGHVNNRLVLGLFYVFVIVPASALVRMLARDPMRRGFDSAAASYFTPVDRRVDRETLSDMF
jgi:hypothetical protein